MSENEENERDDSGKKTVEPLTVLIILAGIVMITWGSAWYFILHRLKVWEKAGQFGDLFGSVNALFSGLAFAGLIYTILLQRKELAIQREEVSKTNQELANQGELMRLTLEEMQSQRINALRPEIVIKYLNFRMYWSGEENGGLPSSWTSSKILGDIEPHESFVKLKYSLANIGLHSAMNIRISWAFDVEDFMKHIEILNTEKNLYKIESLNLNNGKEHYLIVLDSPKSHNYFIFKRDPIETIEFISPLKNDNDYIVLDFPSGYQLLVSLLMRLIYYNKKDYVPSDIDYPNIKLKITYQDISGIEYLKEKIYQFQKSGPFEHAINKFGDFAGWTSLKEIE